MVFGRLLSGSLSCIEAIATAGGPSYEAIFHAHIAKAAESHRLLANWRLDCFESACKSTSNGRYECLSIDAMGNVSTEGTALEEKDVTALIKSDKKLLQGYGRPYAATTGPPVPLSFYSMARESGTVMERETWAA